uniref:Group XV phospholipase A2 n=1 Tax=Aceria tosichella TaxID=561515 RepID=A0A6G1SFT1_9ACAR
MQTRHLLAILLLVVAQYSVQVVYSVSTLKNIKQQTNDILASHHDESRLSPVILVPGDGGSRLEAKLDKKDVAHHYCERKSDDWFDLWVNLSLLVPFAIDCWVENMKLVYNTTTRRTQNAPGVITRVKGFARTESVEFVDPAKFYGTNYFDSLVRQLVEFGYERDKNIFGAPYDFRRAPNELEEYYASLEKLIMTAYEQNGNERVVFICHSMGCPYALFYLNTKPQAWKDKYVRSMISLAGVYAGSVKAMKAYASGDNFGVIVVPSLSLRKDVRTFPSLALLMPSPDVWPKNQVLVKNRNISYTASDYKQFFRDIDYPVGYEMWLDVKSLAPPLRAPGVEVHCLHGHKVSTPEFLDYDTGHFPDAKPKVKYGDGDGTVNILSLSTCLEWSGKQKQRVIHRNFTAVDHMTILSDSKVMNYLGEALSKNY